MPFTASQLKRAGKILAREMVVYPKVTAGMNLDDFVAAINAVDSFMDALPGTLNGAQTIKINLVNSLPEPFKSNSTPKQKALVLRIWAQLEVSG